MEVEIWGKKIMAAIFKSKMADTTLNNLSTKALIPNDKEIKKNYQFIHTFEAEIRKNPYFGGHFEIQDG